MQHFERPASRRDFLCRAGGGFGALALYGLLSEGGLLPSQRAFAGGPVPANPLSPKAGQLPGRAKSAIFLFMDGGPSHLDTFDYKPAVTRFAGKPLPKSIKRVFTPMAVTENAVLALPRKWTRCGKSGLRRLGLVSPRRRPRRRPLHDSFLREHRAQSCRQRLDDEHGQPPGRPAQPGRLGQLRLGQRKPQPARLRGPT